MKKTNQSILKEIYKPRDKNKYFRKYDFGFSFILGGSEFYSSPPAISAIAALKTGVDRIRVIAPKRAADIIASFSPEMTAFPLEAKRFQKQHLSTLLSMVEAGKSVSRNNFSLIIGKGLGRSEDSQEVILEAISEINASMVLDADAIHALAKKPEIIKGKKVVLTPHSREFSILTGEKIFSLELEDKIKIVKDQAQKLGVVILLKGQPDIISNGEEVILNEEGSPYMSVGGTGDMLAGICGALLAREEIDPFMAAQAGAYISGRAGQVTASELKEGLTAIDIINNIPKVLH